MNSEISKPVKLFMFYIGGNCGNSNIELHDVRFSIGENPEDCYEDLRRQWWGEPKSLHLDCWGVIEQADGFDVTVTASPPPSNSGSLFFVNLGGYDPSEFSELHRNVLLVAADASAAKVRALAEIQGWTEPHRDKAFEVEKTLDVSALAAQGPGCYLTLTTAKDAKRFNFVCKYRPIGL
jgi:hypothetical protein